jgi:hypothetical protein
MNTCSLAGAGDGACGLVAQVGDGNEDRCWVGSLKDGRQLSESAQHASTMDGQPMLVRSIVEQPDRTVAAMASKIAQRRLAEIASAID